ncbi:YetF domain-containing protein [Rufibacter hautae]|uniref:YetF domain-containing protein n=1 Tax=Rufibacter hautae TaxID=2595005 RepID=UPI0016803F57|nr:YetF domain-containing protein [Rufibacter hautae]
MGRKPLSFHSFGEKWKHWNTCWDAPLVKDGKLLQEQMQTHNITENDIMEVLRTKGGPVDVARIENACLDCSGNSSVVFKEDK